MRKFHRCTAVLLAGLSGCATGIDSELIADRSDRFFRSTTLTSITSEGEREFSSEPPGTLAEYVKQALQNNSGLRSEFDRWEAALERIPQVTALPDPQFTYTNFVEEVQTRTGPQNNRFQLSQKFPWFTKLKRSGDAATEHAESIWWLVETRALALVRDVKVAYYEYAFLAQALRIVEENLSLLQGLEPIVQRRIQTGAGQDELLRLQVEIGKIENEFESLEDRRPAISARLSALLNRNRSSLLPWPEALSIDQKSYRSEELEDLIVRQNPELKSLDFRIRAADERTALARLERFPDFTIGVGFIDTGEAVTSTRPTDSGDDPVSISVGLNLPIWQRKYSASVREARSEKKSTENQRIQRLNDLFWMLEQTLYEFDDAVRQVTLYQDTLIPRVRQALELTETSYETGTATLLDVIDTQRDLLHFEKSYWRAVSDYHQRLAALEALCGGSLP